MKIMNFNPYNGLPRHPKEISSDPSGILMLCPDGPLRWDKLEDELVPATSERKAFGRIEFYSVDRFGFAGGLNLRVWTTPLIAKPCAS